MRARNQTWGQGGTIPSHFHVSHRSGFSHNRLLLVTFLECWRLDCKAFAILTFCSLKASTVLTSRNFCVKLINLH